MAGTKRSWQGNAVHTSTQPAPQSTPAMATSEDPSPMQGIFATFRDELDEHHDRRERLIKTSRDITALSKKIIFSLQRVRHTPAPLPPTIAKETTTRFTQITTLFKSTIPDTRGANSWRYQRQLSGAIQEFIEALSFHHYLQHQRLITLAEVKAHLPAEVLVTEEDYVMGLFDLTGEMMRFAITSLSTSSSSSSADAEVESGGDERVEEKTGGEGGGGGLPPSQAAIVIDLRDMRSLFEGLSVPRRHHMMRDLGKKVDVMQSSVEKVERAAYGILVRGRERPAGWLPALDASGAAAAATEGY